jgi:hypothetical protein
MEALISYFSDLEKRPLERAGFFVAGMIVLWIAENALPLIDPHYKKTKAKQNKTNSNAKPTQQKPIVAW